MKNTIKMLILSAFAGSVLMISAGANAEQPRDTNIVIQDANQDASELNLNDEGSSDNWWGYGGLGGWGYGLRPYGLGIYGLGLGGYGLGGYGFGGYGLGGYGLGGCGCGW